MNGEIKIFSALCFSLLIVCLTSPSVSATVTETNTEIIVRDESINSGQGLTFNADGRPMRLSPLYSNEPVSWSTVPGSYTQRQYYAIDWTQWWDDIVGYDPRGTVYNYYYGPDILWYSGHYFDAGQGNAATLQINTPRSKVSTYSCKGPSPSFEVTFPFSMSTGKDLTFSNVQICVGYPEITFNKRLGDQVNTGFGEDPRWRVEVGMSYEPTSQLNLPFNLIAKNATFDAVRGQRFDANLKAIGDVVVRRSTVTSLTASSSRSKSMTIDSSTFSSGLQFSTWDLEVRNSTLGEVTSSTATGSVNLSNVTVPGSAGLILSHNGNDLNINRLIVNNHTSLYHNSGTPFHLGDLTLGTFNLNFQSINHPEDIAVEAGSTPSRPVAEIVKAVISGHTSITGTDNSYLYLKQLTTRGTVSIASNATVEINGGTYQGSPALTGNNVTVKRGTFTDLSGNSQFMIDPDSEAQVTTEGNKTITMVKLSNPPKLQQAIRLEGVTTEC